MQQMHNAETGINPSRCRLQQIKDNCCGLLFFCFLILYFAINDADLLGLIRKAYLVARKLKLRDFEEWINHESAFCVVTEDRAVSGAKRMAYPQVR